MKKLISIILIIAVGMMSGLAMAGGTLTFTAINSVTNSASKDFGVSGDDYWCEITNRTGNNDIVVTLQGTNLNTDAAWVNTNTNTTIANGTTKGPSWQFQSLDYYAKLIRLHVVSGADVTNTISGKCGQGGR
jgi:hypothetical protein